MTRSNGSLKMEMGNALSILCPLVGGFLESGKRETASCSLQYMDVEFQRFVSSSSFFSSLSFILFSIRQVSLSLTLKLLSTRQSFA